MSPTQRTKAKLKAEGVTCQIVERWNAYAKVRVDLFGCIDIIAIRAGKILGIQCTDGTSHSKREEKARLEPRIREWVAAGAGFEVWSWRRLAARRPDRSIIGKRKVWTLRVSSPVVA